MIMSLEKLGLSSPEEQTHHCCWTETSCTDFDDFGFASRFIWSPCPWKISPENQKCELADG